MAHMPPTTAKRLLDELYEEASKIKPDPEQDWDAIAKPTWDFFSALKRKGFNDAQALELVNTWFGKMLDETLSK